MVRYGCAKTDSGGVECFVEFSEATTLLDSISSRCCRSFRIQIAKQRDESEGKKEKKNTRLSYIETEKKRKKRDAVRFANSKLAVKEKKKEEKKTLELNPSVFVLSFLFLSFFSSFLDRY